MFSQTFRTVCPNTREWIVMKHPVNNLEYGFPTLLGQRASFPNMRIVWMERDIPNTVW